MPVPSAMREVTVVLRPKEAHDWPQTGVRLTRDEHLRRHGADEQDLSRLLRHATMYGLEPVTADKRDRTVVLRGSDSQLHRAFLTEPRVSSLDGAVVAVLGLDDRPVAHPYLRPAALGAQALTATQVAKAYNYPDSTGAGEGIAIIELGGGFDQADLDAYFRGLGLAAPQVSAIGVSGGKNVPGGDPQGADGEVLLDIEVAGAVAPGAKIGVFFAPNTDAGFLAAINAAIHDGSFSVISISWGGPESSWSASAMSAYDQAFADAASLGISVFCAAGDRGSTDGTGRNVADFPASSPHVMACGGTRLVLNADGSRAAETVWDDSPTSSATGGGYSSAFTRPDYQPASIGSRRGVPDMAANADPQSGYVVIVDGQQGAIGGTSAVAPLLAGLTARLNALTGTKQGLLNEAAYKASGAFFDVTSGNNGGYKAGTGWDADSGLGVPDGSKLLAALQGTPPQPPSGGGGGGTPPGGGGTGGGGTPPPSGGGPTPEPAGCFRVGPLSHRVQRRLERDAGAVGLSPDEFLTQLVEYLV